jgi:DHA2 family multidrug resistance protein
MINVMRNIGGSIGIALVATVIARRAQLHQSQLASSVGASGPLLQARLQAMSQAFQHAGASAVEATQKATFAIGHELVRQAQTLATLDAILLFAVFTAAMLPLLFLARKSRPGPPAHG